ncbi:hypothetical protein MNBD_GAMMA18-1309 [hydrothermal vent metagenome]|uniref:General secretion pathway protein N n=1 Tax=hydrothermal vent metagenome TaxID=652676 RepID=A0A3B0Z8N7_9ZZZZ
MKSRIGYALVFCGIYVLSLLAITPASFVSKELESQVEGLALYGVEGTLWSGELQALEINGIRLKNVEWSLSPFALLLGNARLQFALNSDELQSDGVVEIGLLSDSTTLRDVDIRFPIEKYAQQLGVAGFDLSGNIELNLHHLTYQNNLISGLSGVLVWYESGISGALAMGDIQADLEQHDGLLTAILSDRGGPVKLDGDLSLQGSGHYQFKSILEVRDDSDLSLKQTLRLMGRTVGDNRVEVNTNGQVALPVWIKLG